MTAPQAGDVWRKGDEFRAVYVPVASTGCVAYTKFGSDAAYGASAESWANWVASGAVLVHRAGSVTPGETVRAAIVRDKWNTLVYGLAGRDAQTNHRLALGQILGEAQLIGWADVPLPSVPVVAAAVEGFGETKGRE